jgi:predicted GNAT family acetyltransferase
VRLIGAQQLYYWQHGGRRCMLGLLQRTPRAAALGVVYTPPEHRGQGYASAAVAALNGQLLASGLEQRYFFIDPANRAAQALARKIGCELVQAAVDIDFR